MDEQPKPEEGLDSQIEEAMTAAMIGYRRELSRSVNVAGNGMNAFEMLFALNLAAMEIALVRQFFFDAAGHGDAEKVELVKLAYYQRLAAVIEAQVKDLSAVKIQIPGRK